MSGKAWMAFIVAVCAVLGTNLGAQPYDFGDAPDPYPTTLFEDGARHTPGGPWLGLVPPDTELDAWNAGRADGDDTHGVADEDGAAFAGDLVPGQYASLSLTFSGPGENLTYAVWIDYNGDGNWEYPEELYASGNVSKLPGLPLNITIAKPIPAEAKVGTTYVRCRVYQGLNALVSPLGAAVGGEVEDFAIQIQSKKQPALSVGTIWGLAFNDLDGDGQYDLGEPGLRDWTIWVDRNGNSRMDAKESTLTGADGHFSFADLPVGTYTVYEEPQHGWTQTCPGRPSFHTVTLRSDRRAGPIVFGNQRTGNPAEQLDWGDAPDPTYPTLRASDGAYHVIVPGFCLGASVDAEADGQTSPDATGDDSGGSDDDDGVTFLTALVPGGLAQVRVVASAPGKLDAWIDFDGDGDWLQPTDQIVSSAPVNGTRTLTFDVPASARLGSWTFARFRFSRQGDLPSYGPASDGEVEDYRVWLGEPGPGGPAQEPGLVGWSQPPIEFDPNAARSPIFCGWDEPAFYGKVKGEQNATSRMVVDDFRSLGPQPVTRMRWWGSYSGWTNTTIPKAQPDRWQIRFWSGTPVGVDAGFGHPSGVVQQLEVPAERVRIQSAGMEQFPQRDREACFVYDLDLEPKEYFQPVEGETSDGVFWLGITASYRPDVEVVNPWGWQARPQGWLDNALAFKLQQRTSVPDLDPKQMVPVASDTLCPQPESFGMAFELGTEQPSILWDQPFTGIRQWPYYEDLEAQLLSIRGNEKLDRIVADDWTAASATPVTAVTWWGSYMGYGYEAGQCPEEREPPRPDYFLLTLRADIPPDREFPYSRPGDTIWRYRAYEYDEVLVGYDRNPVGEPNEPVYRYSVRLPEGNWFHPAAGGMYWFCVTAVFTDPFPLVVHPWGWTSHPLVSGTGAEFIDYRLITEPQWRPLRDPQDQSIDMSFTLFTRPE